MRVEIVSTTAVHANLAEQMSSDELIAYLARVTSPHRQEDHASAPRLLRYCIEHGHWSPFEMVDMTVEIETSRAIAAQILRHRSFSFQEFSQRYAKADMGFERFVARRQDTKNRQNSIDDINGVTKHWFDCAQQEVEHFAEEFYNAALDRGIAKELARMLLPLSTKTRLYMKGSVRSWIHYLKARLDPTAQKEHRDVAEAIRVIFAREFPNVYAAAFDAPSIEKTAP